MTAHEQPRWTHKWMEEWNATAVNSSGTKAEANARITVMLIHLQHAFDENDKLVAALKARDEDAEKRTEYFNKLHRRFLDVISERTQLRADLTRVEAERDDTKAALASWVRVAKDLGGQVEEAQALGLGMLQEAAENEERLQARIAVLEGSLREYLDQYDWRDYPILEDKQVLRQMEERARAVLEGRDGRPQ